MNLKVLCMILFGVVSAESMADERVPNIFHRAPLIDLPISVGKSSYGGVIVSVPKDGGDTQNKESYAEMDGLQKHIEKIAGRDIFSTDIDILSQSLKKSRVADFWQVSLLPSPFEFGVYILHTRGSSWMILSKDGEVVGAELVNARQYSVKADGFYGAPVATLDTMFGEVGLFPYPETDYEKTGIFCSVLTTTLPDGNEKTQIFKRRITTEGKIENKEMPEGVHECKLPW